MVGRLNPKTGEIKLHDFAHGEIESRTAWSSTPKAFRTSWSLARTRWPAIDPETLEIHEYVLPHEESRPRRVAITPDDVIYYSDYSRGLSGAVRHQDRRDDGMAVAGRAEVAALRDHHCERHCVVQRIEHQAEYDRALRSQDGEVPDLGDPIGRRSGAKHGAFAGRADAVDRVQRDEPHRRSADQGNEGFAEELTEGRLR